MERWRVPAAIALELIEFPGKLGKEGNRPRFRFATRQQRIASYLSEIDAVLAATGNDHVWLRPSGSRSNVARAGVRPERCASSAQTGRLHRMLRYENAFQSSFHLRTSKWTRTLRRILATCQAMS
jgi:hypothetical protein